MTTMKLYNGIKQSKPLQTCDRPYYGHPNFEMANQMQLIQANFFEEMAEVQKMLTY